MAEIAALPATERLGLLRDLIPLLLETVRSAALAEGVERCAAYMDMLARIASATPTLTDLPLVYRMHARTMRRWGLEPLPWGSP
jgi:hypothetical protein